jgi:hypothetical protein
VQGFGSVLSTEANAGLQHSRSLRANIKNTF